MYTADDAKTEKLRRSLEGGPVIPRFGGGGGGGGGTPAAPVLTRPAAAVSPGNYLGQSVRQAATSIGDHGVATLDALSSPMRHAAGGVANFARGLAGAPATDATPPGIRDSLARASALLPSATPPGAAPAGAGSSGPLSRPRIAARPVATTATPATAAPAPAGTIARPDGVFQTPYKLPDGRTANAYSATGTTVANALARGNPGVPQIGTVAAQNFGTGGAAPALAGVAPVTAAPVVAPEVGFSRPRADRAAETERQRLQGDIDTRLFQLGGNLDTRGKKQLASDLLGLKRDLTGKRIDQTTGLATEGARLASGAAAQEAGLAAGVGEANSRNALDAAQGNATIANQQALQRNAIQSVLTGADGTAGSLRGDGSLTPVTGPDGKPYKVPLPAAAGQITPELQVDALTKQLAALDSLSDPDGSQRAAIGAQLKQVLGTGGAGKPDRATWLASAKQSNPKASDAELAAYYDQNYGR
jgi:hypothetical protein